MNRRSTLATLLGKNKKTAAQTTLVNASLAPYTGPWGIEQAAHLLRRTTFGPTYAQIQQAANDGLQTTLAQLFADQPLPDPPIYFNFNNDPGAGLGETWVNADTNPTIQGLNGARQVSLRVWHFGLLYNAGVSLREQMVLFWHNHFVTADINDARQSYQYINLIRENVWGNFRDLTKAITISPAMLVYLNGNQNSAVAPNENYSRELLELFTIGKGDLAGPGDYTNYTEEDVVQMAKSLTGWISRDRNDPQLVKSTFVPQRHDTSTKQLSARFNNAIIQDAGDQEYSNLIDLIFQQDEVARFICRKLYRWFVHYTIDDSIEVDIIEPMAQLLIQNDYNIQPVLKALLESEHFFNVEEFGCKIKNPVDFTFSLVNSFELSYNGDIIAQHLFWNTIYRAIIPLEMVIYDHPSVAGWKAYYQEPQFYRIWINSASLPVRMNILMILINGYRLRGQDVKIDVLDFTSKLDNAIDPNTLIAEFVSILFPRAITDEQVVYLKEVLIPGLPDFEWSVEYSEYLADPSNEELKNAVESKLRSMLLAMLSMSEFQLH